ncbi:hypothetical protein Kpol_1013p79 [Vanderwaltozyma polyspora DSM 70294]|uniref:Phospholipid scramblase n=1 Tax=Vanderwaltozyma polyspora (strain ATCC 22028 / DSM 70294 / BCRC 21397 / CBS 2163 / NBRC 10782 / NRRL Y-8283 / UCD 57-17) TaxID=436907 RepID=A7THC3_VANPO|nr:uncharacterized protein Kpol_1013p79 [Vanderwaltozyma polyspora DSM 70294]EDO18404.1 hypothetical protein Kpol_1013p79 [Vanderwaltozyma polyspora DSM 70294]
MFRQVYKRLLSSTSINGVRNGPFRRINKNVNSSDSLRQSPMLTNPNTTFIQSHHPIATQILNEPTVIIERQIEMMNVFLGFEQANKYSIMDVMGNRIGYMMERDFSIGKAILRQLYRLHRPFTVDVFDNWGNVILTIHRPFSWINSHIKAYLPPSDISNYNYKHSNENYSGITSNTFSVPPGRNMPIPQNIQESDDVGILVGESIQNWHLWRRRYELFQRDVKEDVSFSQYGEIDAPFLSFDFPVADSEGKIMAGVDRNWVGLGRELFTDTGVYIVRFDSTRSFEGIYPPESISNQVLTFDQRAVLLANAVSIDFDYFSRHSRTGGGLLSFGSYDD